MGEKRVNDHLASAYATVEIMVPFVEIRTRTRTRGG
jgi:hypothetical protein